MRLSISQILIIGGRPKMAHNSFIYAIQLIAPTNKQLNYTDMKWIKGKPKAEDIEWLDESAPLSEGDGKYTRADMRKAIIFGSKMMYKDGVPPNANEQDDFIDLIKQ